MHTHSLSIHPDSGRALRPWELALLLAVCVTLLTGTWAQARSQLLAARLVRLHVIAVSDDDAEQAVKLQVRDAVLAYLGPQLADVADIGAAQQIIAGDLDGIARAAQAAAGERPVRVSLGPEHYPTRDYGTFALPAGVYTSLRVTLGAGAGHNWWCVLYPSLCFLDESHGIVSEEKKEDLREVLTEEEFLTILNDPEKRDQVKIGFKWF